MTIKDLKDITSFKWATITHTSPLEVKLDGDTDPLEIIPDSLVDPQFLAVDDRVRVELSLRKCVIHGRSRGSGNSGRKNRVINGNFRTNQRGYVSGATLATGAYGFDRWKASAAGTTLTFTAAPQGQLVTINSAHAIQQVIERANVEAGGYVLAQSGTAQGRVYNVGSTAPPYASGPILVTLDGLADVIVEFGPGTVGEVQLERGSTPTPFERVPVSEELALCQRYYEKSYAPLDKPGTATLNGGVVGAGVGGGVTTGYIVSPIRYAVTKRVSPTVTVYDSAGAAGKVDRQAWGVGGSPGNIAAITYSVETGAIVHSASGYAAGLISFHFTAEAEL